MTTEKADYEVAREDMARMLDDLGVQMAAEFIPTPPPAPTPQDFRFTITLTRGRMSFTTSYRMGSGHVQYDGREWIRRLDLEACLRYGKGRLRGFRYSVFAPVPALVDVMYALFLDASNTDLPLEEWAVDYGYDPDSRTAERTYNACTETAKNLRRMFSPTEYATLDELSSRF